MSQFPPRAFIRMATVPEKLDSHGLSSPASQEELKFLSLRDVLDRLTISRSLLYELMKDPVRPFPRPFRIGRRSVWEKSEVLAYMQTVIDETRGRHCN